MGSPVSSPRAAAGRDDLPDARPAPRRRHRVGAPADDQRAVAHPRCRAHHPRARRPALPRRDGRAGADDHRARRGRPRLRRRRPPDVAAAGDGTVRGRPRRAPRDGRPARAGPPAASGRAVPRLPVLGVGGEVGRAVLDAPPRLVAPRLRGAGRAGTGPRADVPAPRLRPPQPAVDRRCDQRCRGLGGDVDRAGLARRRARRVQPRGAGRHRARRRVPPAVRRPRTGAAAPVLAGDGHRRLPAAAREAADVSPARPGRPARRRGSTT